jgi:hypothetical protein
MKSHKINRFVRVFALLLTSIIVIKSQNIHFDRKETVQTNNLQNASDSSSPEVKLIEKAYKKMTIAHMASRLNRARGGNQPYDHNKTLQFKLKNFREGSIEEIRNTLIRNLVTPPSGDIVQVGTGTTTINRTDENGVVTSDEPKFSIDAQWVKGQYASMNDSKWTLGDILQFEAARYYDIGKYISYEVEISLDNKKNTYRALALFHNPQQSQPLETLKPEFLDSVVGMGGTITQVFRETKPPLGTRRYSNQTANLSSSEKSYPKKHSEEETSNLACPPDLIGCGGQCLEWYQTTVDPSYTYCLVWESWGGGGDGELAPRCTSKEMTRPEDIQNGRDETSHNDGEHFAEVGFEAKCTRDRDCNVSCKVEDSRGVFTKETGSRFYDMYHVPKWDFQQENGSGGVNQNISCKRVRGVGFKSCIWDTCWGQDFNVSVTLAGVVTISPSSNEIWKIPFSHQGNCQMGRRD